MANRVYSTEELNRLRQNVEELGPTKGIAATAKEFNRTVGAVSLKYYASVAKHVTMPAKKTFGHQTYSSGFILN